MMLAIRNENFSSSQVRISAVFSPGKDCTGVRFYGSFSQKKILLLNFADQFATDQVMIISVFMA